MNPEANRPWQPTLKSENVSETTNVQQMSEFITRFHATSKFCERLSSDITLAEMTSYIFPNCFGETGSDKYILILVNELPPSYLPDGCGQLLWKPFFVQVRAG